MSQSGVGNSSTGFSGLILRLRGDPFLARACLGVCLSGCESTSSASNSGSFGTSRTIISSSGLSTGSNGANAPGSIPQANAISCHKNAVDLRGGSDLVSISDAAYAKIAAASRGGAMGEILTRQKSRAMRVRVPMFIAGLDRKLTKLPPDWKRPLVRAARYVDFLTFAILLPARSRL